MLHSVLPLALAALAALSSPADGPLPVDLPEVQRGALARPAASMAHSPPLWLLRPGATPSEGREDSAPRLIPRPARRRGAPVDGALQPPPALALLTPLGIKPAANFVGLGVGIQDYRTNAVPPDTNGAVGPAHFVQMVNTDFAVFDKKTGNVLYGPLHVNALFQGLGGGCEVDNDGDPVVVYDQLADRWVLTQFSVSTASRTPTGSYLECVAVSKTSDPTGAYTLYAFDYHDFNDYPKLCVWPDGYYATFNLFDDRVTGSPFIGGEVCAYDRIKMLAGLPAAQQCFKVGSSYGGLLASSVDGKTPPPAGAPNHLLALGLVEGQLATWRFHVDWVNPAQTTLTGPVTLETAPYQLPCPDNKGRLSCVPQAGGALLDSLGDQPMFRYAYRNFGDHQALVANHTVHVGQGGARTGVRWYELRIGEGGAPFIYQQGTYAPDLAFRWLASAAMDQAGNLAIGYSVSSGTSKPGLRAAGRLAGDGPGVLTLTELSLFEGGAAQSGIDRWGDYSATVLDPSDDCTFYFTSEYLTQSNLNWSTRAASFKLPNCPRGSDGPDFALRLSTTGTTTLKRTESVRFTVTGTAVSGVQGPVVLSAPGLPAGLLAAFNPATLTPGQGQSELVLTASTSSPVGSLDFVVSGLAGSGLAHAATAAVVVLGNDFSLAVSPASRRVLDGSASFGLTTALTGGAAEPIALSVSGLPAGFTGTFSEASITGAGSSALTVRVPAGAPGGKSSFLVTGTSPSVVRQLAAEVVVPNEWGFVAGAAVTVAQGQEARVELKSLVMSGSAEPVTLSVLGAPGVKASLVSPSTAAGQPATVVVTAEATAPLGATFVRVQGASATQQHDATVAVTVVEAPGCASAGAEFAAALGLCALLRRRRIS